MDKGVIKWYRAAHWLYKHHMKPLAACVKAATRIVWGGVIPYQTEIGEGTFFTYHALGVVINGRTVIGKNCKIRQNVTMGANGDGAPTLGDNVEVGAGAVIIGPVKIGNNVKIGANAFVNTDLPDNCTAVGMPAKPVKYS